MFFFSSSNSVSVSLLPPSLPHFFPHSIAFLSCLHSLSLFLNPPLYSFFLTCSSFSLLTFLYQSPYYLFFFHIFVCLCFCLSPCLPFFYYSSIYLLFLLSNCLLVFLSVSLSVCLSLRLSPFVALSLSVSICLRYYRVPLGLS